MCPEINGEVRTEDGLIVVEFGECVLRMEPHQAQRLSQALSLAHAMNDIPLTFKAFHHDRSE